jgi:phospholipase C
LPSGIQHVFVLMLENRSFDHMLGFSGVSGTDAISGGPTSANSLTLAGSSLLQLARSWQRNTVSGIVLRQERKWPPPPTISLRALLASNMSNMFNGQSFSVTQPADYAMPVDPSHEFCRDPANNILAGVLQQLCGADAVYPFGGAYPPILNSGFVTSYAASGGQSNPGEVMKCYSPSELPVLNALAQEFVVCDNWQASMPGPTWPNRFFAHAASSGGLDHSPSTAEIAEWDSVDGFSFANGTIFDRMKSASLSWRIYAGDDFPIVGALKGINIVTDIHHYSDFASDVAQSNYPASYTHIEPSYGHFWSDYKCGTSQHPLDDVTRGESLIKATYEAIRNSPLWSSSLIIITWDEHGGFYDHVPPPPAVAPGDTAPGSAYNQYGFTFQQYGLRVPTVVISPLIPPNLIDHRVYDHASIPATLETCFGLAPMTQRDANARNLMPLVSSSPRGDTPTTLPAPAQSGVTGCDPVSFARILTTTPVGGAMAAPVTRPQDSFDEGNFPGRLFVVLRSDLTLSPAAERPAILARFNALKTRADASAYTEEVRVKVLAARNALSQRTGP